MGAAFFVPAIVMIAIGIPVMGGVWSARGKERIRLRACPADRALSLVRHGAERHGRD